MRVSGLPTAWSNVLMGAAATGLFSRPGFVLTLSTVQLILTLLAVSSCLYIGGMILNDVCDLEADRRERPERVLPSGRISVATARWAATAFLIGGVMLAAFSALEFGKRGMPYFVNPSFGTALALLVAIVIYNRVARESPFGPVVMGVCRALNVLLGASCLDSANEFAGFGALPVFVAVCVGTFVAGITWFSSEEHTAGSRRTLIAGALVMGAAVTALLWLPSSELLWKSVSRLSFSGEVARSRAFRILLLLVLLPAARRVCLAIASPESARIQQAVVACLRSLIMIDAALCYLFVPDRPFFAATVALLIVPAFVVGRWIRLT